MKKTSTPKINNLKVHILLDNSGVTCLRKSLFTTVKKSYNNFSVVKDTFTYIIFPQRGFVNITGIKGFLDIVRVIPHFCLFFGLDECNILSDIVVDNISASGNFWQRVNLVQLHQAINKKKVKSCFVSCTFDRNRFPGAFCRTRGFGTLTLFPSGKYVVVGAKCQEHVDNIFQQMSVVIAIL